MRLPVAHRHYWELTPVGLHLLSAQECGQPTSLSVAWCDWMYAVGGGLHVTLQGEVEGDTALLEQQLTFCMWQKQQQQQLTVQLHL